MNDYLRESLSYFGIYRELSKVKKIHKPEKVSFGDDKNQYFYYYEPSNAVSKKVIVWVHGGGWNAGGAPIAYEKKSYTYAIDTKQT